MVWFLRFVIVFTVHVPETDAKALFRKANYLNLSEFHKFQVEVLEHLCLSPFVWAARAAGVSVLLCMWSSELEAGLSMWTCNTLFSGDII